MAVVVIKIEGGGKPTTQAPGEMADRGVAGVGRPGLEGYE